MNVGGIGGTPRINLTNIRKHLMQSKQKAGKQPTRKSGHEGAPKGSLRVHFCG